MAIEVITAPTPRFGDACNLRVFLAGSIDMGSAVDWQSELIERASSFDDKYVTFYNPRRSKVFSGEQSLYNDDFAGQVNWEIDHIDRANIVVFYITAESKAPITMFELGYFMGKTMDDANRESVDQKPRVVVGVEQGFWRRGNIEVMCDRFGVQLYDNLDDVASVLEDQLRDCNKVFFT
jgi:hypothetical protein